MTSPDFQSWVQRARAVPIETEIERRGIKLRRVGLERVGACPKCGGDDRFAIHTRKKVFNCRGCGAKGDVIQLVQDLDGVDFNTACAVLAGPPPKKGNGKANGKHADHSKKVVVATFEYPDANGNVLFAKDRIEFQKPDGTFVLKDGKPDKTFRQRRPDPDHPGKWINNVDGVPVVPWLPELIEAVANDHTIFVVEGEAKVDLLWSWNLAATCCAGGAKKWKPEHSAFLRNADVVLVPDNDIAGWEHINGVGSSLSGIAKRVRVLVLPLPRAKDDVIDWAEAGGTREQLDALLDNAKDWRPAVATEQIDKHKADAKAHEDELIDQLSKLKGLELARELKHAARELDVTMSALDAEVRSRREAAPLHGHWEVEPWPDPVEGDSLLRDIIMRLRRHVICSLEDAVVIALWVMHAWVHEGIAIHSPILNINSAEPESGKSTTLGLISLLAPRCIGPSVEISEAALYRAIKRWQPSFVIDEFDSVLASDDKVALRSVINSGHTRGTGVIRCIGDDKVPELFPTFCPKAIGMCGKSLPAATLSRCVFVELRRRKHGEKIERFKHEDDPDLADLRRRLLRWSMDNEDALRAAAPSMPDGFDNRRGDNWRVMLGIADLCSGAEDWGDKARAAAVKIEGKTDSRTSGARALTDAKAIFFPKDADDRPLEPLERISSADLVAQLAAYPDSPWAEWRHGKPITQAQLARVLKPYGIAPQLIRLPRGGVMRGYLRTQFDDAWDRYL